MNRDIVVLKAFDGSSEPSYILSADNRNYLVLTENMNRTRFRNIVENENIDYFETVIYCPEKYEDCPYISDYTDNVITVTEGTSVENDIFRFDSYIEKRSMAYVIDVAGVKATFNHKKTDVSQYQSDFYFFGSDTPADFSAEQSYYFYPVIKANKAMTIERNTTELYGPLTIKINRKTGKYTVIKDVKNFGSQL